MNRELWRGIFWGVLGSLPVWALLLWIVWLVKK